MSSTLELAHQLDFVWVARLYDGKVTTLDPPEHGSAERTLSLAGSNRRYIPYHSIIEESDSPELLTIDGITMQERVLGSQFNNNFEVHHTSRIAHVRSIVSWTTGMILDAGSACPLATGS